MTQSTNPMFAKDRFLPGTFSSNCSSGMTVTKVPERWNNSFGNNLRLAHLLGDAGIDFMLPIARWIGYGGETDLHGSVLETMTRAAGHGGFPLIGTPEQVADGIASPAAAGLRGSTLSFVDYAEEFPYFRDTVLPLLAEKGIR